MLDIQIREHLGLQPSTVLAPHFGGRRLIDISDTSADDNLAQRASKGLRANEFHLVFHGAYEAARGELRRVEAQVHWNHPDYGLLLPGAFISKLEQSDVAYEMSLFIAEKVCHELQTGKVQGLKPCTVAFSVPPAVVVNEGFASDVVSIARAHGVAPNLLEIEVNDSEDAARLLALRTLTSDLRDSGVSLSYGEFGSGHSPLANLAVLDVDTVKLSRGLMATVPSNERSRKVMSSVLGLLASLDIRVVASGVDTAAQAEWISEWPDVLVQGAYVSKAARTLAQLIRDGDGF
jgi:EAL domain-containing protein (putative c-di-GMP-specific phosphodiesterase class I)